MHSSAEIEDEEMSTESCAPNMVVRNDDLNNESPMSTAPYLQDNDIPAINSEYVAIFFNEPDLPSDY